jgi:hypothetical protein
MARNSSTPAVLVDDLIRWYDHNYFRGYVFSTVRRGRRYVKHFSVKPGGVRKALTQAREYRDAMLKILEPPTRLHSTHSTNTTGVVGVILAKERTHAGGFAWRYVATWPVKGRRRRAKASFAVAKYGKTEARRLAINARTKGVAAYKASVSFADYRELGRRKRKGG